MIPHSFIQRLMIVLIVIGMAGLRAVGDVPDGHGILSVTLRESAGTLPPWKDGKSNALEAVRIDVIQPNGGKTTLFADMRTRRSPDWPASEYADVPYIFMLDLSGKDAAALAPGLCTVIASRWGFKDREKQVMLRQGETSEITLELKRDPYFEMIVSPRLMTAETVLSGDSFTIELDAPQTADDWSVSISTEYFSIPLDIVEAAYGRTAIRRGTEPGWKLTVTIDDGVPQELYDLTVSHSHAKSVQPKAVKVLKEYPDPMYIVGNFHHVLDSIELSPDKEIASLFRDTVNIINPVFYANVDDVGYEDERIWGRISYCLQRYLNVPYYHGLGNHDRGLPSSLDHYGYTPVPDEKAGIEYYNYYCGMPYQSRSIGDRLLVILPYCPDQLWTFMDRPDQYNWIKDELRRHKTKDLRLLACHHPVMYRENDSLKTTDLLDEQYRLNMVLVDTVHRPGDTVGDVPTFFGGVYKSPKLDKTGLLRIAKTEPSQSLPRCQTHVMNGYYVTFCVINTFSVHYSQPNDGTRSSVTAIIERKSDTREIVIESGLLRFVLKKGRYTADKGQVFQQVSSDDGLKTIVYVAVEIGCGITTVSVSPDCTGSTEIGQNALPVK